MYDIHIHITRRHNIHLSRAQIANIYLFVTRVFINDNRFNRRIMIPGMMASVMLYDERESAVNNGQWRIKYDTWSSCQTPSSDNEWRFVNVVTQGNERGDANEPKTTTDVRFREVKRYIKKKYMEAIVLSPPSSHHACACMRYNNQNYLMQVYIGLWNVTLLNFAIGQFSWPWFDHRIFPHHWDGGNVNCEMMIMKLDWMMLLILLTYCWLQVECRA